MPQLEARPPDIMRSRAHLIHGSARVKPDTHHPPMLPQLLESLYLGQVSQAMEDGEDLTGTMASSAGTA